MNSPNPGFKLGPFVLEPNGPMLIVSHPLGLKGRNIRVIISSWDRDIGLVCHDWWNVALPKVICQGKAHLHQVTAVFCSLQYTKITTVKTFRRAQSHCSAVHPTTLSQKQEKNLNGYKNNLSEKILLLNWFVEVATIKRTATINK